MEQWRPSEISLSLMKISEIMASGVDFVILREVMEKWEKEAEEGNKDSKQLLDRVYNFEKLITVVMKRAK